MRNKDFNVNSKYVVYLRSSPFLLWICDASKVDNQGREAAPQPNPLQPGFVTGKGSLMDLPHLGGGHSLRLHLRRHNA